MGTSNKNILGERASDDKKVGEFVHFNVFERQTPFEVIHGKITNRVIQIKMYMFFFLNLTLFKPEMIFANPAVKCCVAN